MNYFLYKTQVSGSAVRHVISGNFRSKDYVDIVFGKENEVQLLTQTASGTLEVLWEQPVFGTLKDLKKYTSPDVARLDSVVLLSNAGKICFIQFHLALHRFMVVHSLDLFSTGFPRYELGRLLCTDPASGTVAVASFQDRLAVFKRPTDAEFPQPPAHLYNELLRGNDGDGSAAEAPWTIWSVCFLETARAPDGSAADPRLAVLLHRHGSHSSEIRILQATSGQLLATHRLVLGESGKWSSKAGLPVDIAAIPGCPEGCVVFGMEGLVILDWHTAGFAAAGACLLTALRQPPHTSAPFNRPAGPLLVYSAALPHTTRGEVLEDVSPEDVMGEREKEAESVAGSQGGGDGVPSSPRTASLMESLPSNFPRGASSPSSPLLECVESSEFVACWTWLPPGGSDLCTQTSTSSSLHLPHASSSCSTLSSSHGECTNNPSRQQTLVMCTNRGRVHALSVACPVGMDPPGAAGGGVWLGPQGNTMGLQPPACMQLVDEVQRLAAWSVELHPNKYTMPYSAVALVGLPCGRVIMSEDSGNVVLLRCTADDVLHGDDTRYDAQQTMQATGPCVDFDVADLEGVSQNQVYAACGTGGSGQISVITVNETVMTHHETPDDFSGLTRMWSLPASLDPQSPTALLFMAFVQGTRVLRVTPEGSFYDVTSAMGISSSESTIAAGLLEEGIIAQVTQSRVLLYRVDGLSGGDSDDCEDSSRVAKHERRHSNIGEGEGEQLQPTGRMVKCNSASSRLLRDLLDVMSLDSYHATPTDTSTSSSNSNMDEVQQVLGGADEVWQPAQGVSISTAAPCRGVIVLHCTQLKCLVVLSLASPSPCSPPPQQFASPAKRKRCHKKMDLVASPQLPLVHEVSTLDVAELESGALLCVVGTCQPSVELLAIDRGQPCTLRPMAAFNLNGMQAHLRRTFWAEGESSSSVTDPSFERQCVPESVMIIPKHSTDNTVQVFASLRSGHVIHLVADVSGDTAVMTEAGTWHLASLPATLVRLPDSFRCCCVALCDRMFVVRQKAGPSGGYDVSPASLCDVMQAVPLTLGPQEAKLEDGGSAAQGMLLLCHTLQGRLRVVELPPQRATIRQIPLPDMPRRLLIHAPSEYIILAVNGVSLTPAGAPRLQNNFKLLMVDSQTGECHETPHRFAHDEVITCMCSWQLDSRCAVAAEPLSFPPPPLVSGGLDVTRVMDSRSRFLFGLSYSFWSNRDDSEKLFPRGLYDDEESESREAREDVADKQADSQPTVWCLVVGTSLGSRSAPSVDTDDDASEWRGRLMLFRMKTHVGGVKLAEPSIECVTKLKLPERVRAICPFDAERLLVSCDRRLITYRVVQGKFLKENWINSRRANVALSTKGDIIAAGDQRNSVVLYKYTREGGWQVLYTDSAVRPVTDCSMVEGGGLKAVAVDAKGVFFGLSVDDKGDSPEATMSARALINMGDSVTRLRAGDLSFRGGSLTRPSSPSHSATATAGSFLCVSLLGDVRQLTPLHRRDYVILQALEWALAAHPLTAPLSGHDHDAYRSADQPLQDEVYAVRGDAGRVTRNIVDGDLISQLLDFSPQYQTDLAATIDWSVAWQLLWPDREVGEDTVEPEEVVSLVKHVLKQLS